MGDIKSEYKLVKLDQDNYAIWKWQFKNVIRAKKLTKVFENENADVEMDSQALALLGSALNEENMLKIINCTTFKDAWKTIELCFENKTTYEPQALYRKLNSYKINSAIEVSKSISEMKGIVAQLKNLGESVSDNCLIGSILSALPSSFEIFITVWKNSADKNVDSLISKLMSEASDQSIREATEAKAFATRNKDQSKNKFDRDTCRYCKDKGHWIKDCPKLPTPYDPDFKKNNKNASNAEEKPSSSQKPDDFAFVTRNKSMLFPSDLWVADSGCTNHMSPFKYLFKNINKTNEIGKIRLADDNVQLKVEGQGDIVTNKGTLKNVLYVPELSQNLFSISASASRGIIHVGSKDRIVFYYNDKEVFVAYLKDMLYIIQLKPDILTAHVKAASLTKWHDRFGHISQDTIKHMAKNKIVDGLDITRQVAFVSSKDQIADEVKKFVNQAQLDTGNLVLKIVSDNGGEFVNNSLKGFFKDRGIIHETSVAYVPEQNGLVEREMRTIKEAAKTILNKSKLDKIE